MLPIESATNSIKKNNFANLSESINSHLTVKGNLLDTAKCFKLTYWHNSYNKWTYQIADNDF